MRVRVSSSQSATSISSATSIMKPRYSGNVRAEACVNSGPSSSAGTRYGTGWPAPDQLHQLDDHVRQAEGEQQLGHVAELVHAAQAEALDQRAEHADHAAARAPAPARSRSSCVIW